MVSSLDRSRAISLSLPEAVSLRMVKVPRIRFLFCRGSSVPSRCSVVLGSGSCACARTALASCSLSLHTECYYSVTSFFTHYPKTAEKHMSNARHFLQCSSQAHSAVHATADAARAADQGGDRNGSLFFLPSRKWAPHYWACPQQRKPSSYLEKNR